MRLHSKINGQEKIPVLLTLDEQLFPVEQDWLFHSGKQSKNEIIVCETDHNE